METTADTGVSEPLMTSMELAQLKEAIETFHKRQERKMSQLWAHVNNQNENHNSLLRKGKTMTLKTKADLAAKDFDYERRMMRDFVKTGILQKSLSATDERGAFMMPYAIQDYIGKALQPMGSVRSLARVSAISTDSLDVIYDIQDSEAGWVSEKEERMETKAPAMQRQRIAVHEVYAKPMISQKLLDDSWMDAEAWILESIAESLVKLENESFVKGDGEGKPRGFLSYPMVPLKSGAFGKIESLKTGKNGGLVSLDVFYDAVEAMKTSYLNDAVWYMSRSALAPIRRLKTNDGVSLWQPSVVQGEPDMLLGYPVVLSDDMPKVCQDMQSTPIVLANFKRGYQIVDRHDMRLMRDPYSSKPFVEFYATKRIGGDVIDFEAFKAISFSE